MTHDLLKLFAITGCLLGPLTLQAADAPTNVSTGSTGVTAKGEPYELGGKRLMFTTWQLVRPGSFAWVNERNENVSVAGNQGPTEARFIRADHPHGIRLIAQPARREGPIWHKDLPAGTAGGIAITTVLQDGDTYRAWGTEAEGKEKRTVYYESKDGRNWTRPDVAITLNGQAEAYMNLGEGTIFIDPSAPPAERYKCVTLDHFSHEEYEAFQKKYPDRWEPLAKREDVGFTFYVRGFTSPDGFAWVSLPEPLAVEHSDTQITAYYDTRLGRYVIYTRNWMIDPQSPTTQPGGQPFHMIGRRSIGRTESDTFTRFPLSTPILVPSPEMLPSDVLYTNCRTTVPGGPFFHLMFPSVWHLADDSTTVVLASSHDGRAWSYLPDRKVFDTPAFGEWDGGCVFARPNLIELPDGTFALPYTGYNVPHKYPRGQFRYATGYMTWPRGRLIALQADGLGEFATVAFIAPGRKLLINADIPRGGCLRIEAADIHGTPLPGRSFADTDPLYGDLYKTPYAWGAQDTLGVEPGTPIILRFRLDRARLYGLDFE
ncbi:MAG: hypothetical protein ACUVS7_18540 [Bryobacteraceae bacterium]